MGEIRLLIRQKPVYQIKTGALIHYSGSTPYNLQSTPGPLPIGRQWSGYPGWIDITDDISDLNELSITWSLNVVDSNGIVIPGESDTKVGVTGTLTFEGEAFRLLKSWLAEDVSAPLNSVEALIQDDSCGYYSGFVIRPSELQWCESGVCNFSVNLKQDEEQLNCIKRTFISDDWQGWFPVDGKPLNGKKHPRFSYCVEQRPNGTMIALWYIMGQVLGPMAIIMVLLIVTVINPLIFAINGIILAINTIPGVNVSLINFVSPTAVFDSFTIYFIETAGCGREHPAPLIRDYIANVCDKCGITVNAQSAEVFFAPTMKFKTSSRGELTEPNPYYNACYFFPQTRRGIRRYESVNIFGSSPLNTDEFWIDENRPLLYLNMFLDQLAPVFNSQWRVQNGTLFFQRKDYYLDDDYVYDFTMLSPDRNKILEGICYEPNELKYPASVKGVYQSDMSDMSEAGGNNSTGQMNGVANFGNADNNPNYEGIMDKTVQFGSTKFNLDGASTCYYYDAMQQLANAGLLNLTTLFQTGAIAGALHDVADYALLMQSEIVALPKILCWDGESYTNARCISGKAAWDGISVYPMPDINPAYNNTAELWKYRHQPKTKVLGSALVLGAAPDGIYQVANYFGAPIAEQPALLVNYPMYFEPYYYDTLWDRFHWIDDPNRNPVMNFNWRVKIRLCCDDLDTLGVLMNSQGIVLGQRVKLPFGYYQDGVIKEIKVSYDVTDEYGMWIEISGTL